MASARSSAVLIDTQALIFLRLDHHSLTTKARRTYLDEDRRLYLSVASLWEMAIKSSLGKLIVEGGLDTFVRTSFERLDLNLLQIQTEHVLGVESLPFHHRDPFDRLLASQALREKMAVLSSDTMFDRYGVRRIW